MVSHALVTAATILLVLPMAGAEPSFHPSNSQNQFTANCANNGVVIQATLTSNAINCDGDCENNGVVVQLGAASAYSCDGGCTNNGVIVWGPDLHGSASPHCEENSAILPGACVGSRCTPAPCKDHECGIKHMVPNSDYQASVDTEICKLQWNGNIRCGGSENCAIVENPGCWTIRLSCTLAENQTKVGPVMDSIGIECISWPDYYARLDAGNFNPHQPIATGDQHVQK